MSLPVHTAGDPTGLDLKPAPRRRHALGLPAGSVRALLALMVLAVLWAVALLHQQGHEIPTTYVYLQYLMILILAHFFAAHGKNIGTHVSTRNPLGLPRGAVRLILLLGFAGLIVWMYYHHGAAADTLRAPVTVPLVLLAGFFAGFLLSKLVVALFGVEGAPPYWYQDVEAWVALLAMIGLGVELLLHMINLKLPFEEQLDLSQWEAVLAALVGFYFGARS